MTPRIKREREKSIDSTPLTPVFIELRVFRQKLMTHGMAVVFLLLAHTVSHQEGDIYTP